jgi:NAD(P)H dehydrogenase (quinone)
MKARPPNIFVYGATGTIGRPLVRALIPAVEHESIILRLGVRDLRDLGKMLPNSVHCVLSDLDWSIEALSVSMLGSDTLFLLTGYTAAMVVQSERAVAAAARAGIRHIVHLGAHAAPDTEVEHLQWHLEVERQIKRSGLDWTHLRPNWLMQNALRSVRPMPHGLKIECSVPADRLLSWVDAEDVGALAAGILREPECHRGQTYLLAPERRSFSDMAAIVSRMLDIPCEIYETPSDVLTTRMIGRGELGYARSALHYMETLRAGGAPECADTQDIDALLGRQAVRWPQFVERHRNIFLGQATDAA